jgi:hypothetical protein
MYALNVATLTPAERAVIAEQQARLDLWRRRALNAGPGRPPVESKRAA